VAKKYLLDANVFIQAKNLYYRFDFCEGFWSWIEDAHTGGCAYSILKVKDELMAGSKGDPAKAWASNLPGAFFLADVSNAECMKVYGEVINWAQSVKQYKDNAKEKFASFGNADAFLIAAAKCYGFEIVTQEKSAPDSQSHIYLPDAAKAMKVQTHFIYDFLSKHATQTFKYKSP
jgi:hypothetical protein